VREINKIIVHWSGTETGDVYTFRVYHVSVNGWDDVGYHYVITDKNTVETGRPVWIIGAHCKGKNRDSIGVCYVGSPKCNTITEGDSCIYYPSNYERWILLIDLVKSLLVTHHLSPTDVYGHRDFADTDCPGFDIEILRKAVSE